MARVLFTTPPLTGHLNPALAVAHALAQRGHDVAWAVHAESLREQLPQGTKLYPLSGNVQLDLPAAVLEARGLDSVRRSFQDLALPMAESVLESLEAAVESFDPDVMVVDHQMIGGALVARKLDIPWVTLATSAAAILQMPPMVDVWMKQQLLALQRRHLPQDRIVERPDFSPHAVIVFSIKELLGVSSLVDARYTFVGPARGMGRRAVDFPWHWLKADRKKLLITLGTVSRDRDTRFFEVMMSAVAELEVQAVLVAPESLAQRAPPNVLVRSYVPQLELLEQMDGVICHAGQNTVCEALSRGLPLIVAPIRDDQPVIARQVVAAGAGIFIRHGKVTPLAARSAILSLLHDPGYAASAQKLSKVLQAASGASAAARVIEQCLAGDGAAPASVI